MKQEKEVEEDLKELKINLKSIMKNHKASKLFKFKAYLKRKYLNLKIFQNAAANVIKDN